MIGRGGWSLPHAKARRSKTLSLRIDGGLYGLLFFFWVIPRLAGIILGHFFPGVKEIPETQESARGACGSCEGRLFFYSSVFRIRDSTSGKEVLRAS